MRKYYIDNLRFLCVLLLFPFHTCMIYNTFGENFYVRGPGIRVFNDFLLFTTPWFMPLLFVIAGISSSYALKKRTEKEYIKERLFKLFLPLLSGVLLYIPMQTYYAERFHNQYTGSYLHQYLLFLSKPTDMTGYTGGFTPGNLWFLLYLFIISLLLLLVLRLCRRFGYGTEGIRMKLIAVLPLFLFPMILYPVLNFSGKSIGEYFALFLLGFFILSKDELQCDLEQHRFWLTALALLLLALMYASYYSSWGSDLFYGIVSFPAKWISCLALLGLGKHYLNYSNTITAYLSKASFPIYIFHQSWLVAAAYYVFQRTDHALLQVVFILIISIILTFLNYELFRRIPLLRLMFGIKK